MSDMRQVLQEAEKAVRPFAQSATEVLPTLIADAGDYVHDNRMVMISLPGRAQAEPRYARFSVGDLRAAARVLALIRASLAEGDPPETTVTDAQVRAAADAVVAEWKVMSAELGVSPGATARDFVSPGNFRLVRVALQAAALTTKEQA